MMPGRQRKALPLNFCTTPGRIAIAILPGAELVSIPKRWIQTVEVYEQG